MVTVVLATSNSFDGLHHAFKLVPLDDSFFLFVAVFTFPLAENIQQVRRKPSQNGIDVIARSLKDSKTRSSVCLEELRKLMVRPVRLTC